MNRFVVVVHITVGLEVASNAVPETLVHIWNCMRLTVCNVNLFQGYGAGWWPDQWVGAACRFTQQSQWSFLWTGKSRQSSFVILVTFIPLPLFLRFCQILVSESKWGDILVYGSLFCLILPRFYFCINLQVFCDALSSPFGKDYLVTVEDTCAFLSVTSQIPGFCFSDNDTQNFYGYVLYQRCPSQFRSAFLSLIDYQTSNRGNPVSRFWKRSVYRKL